MSSSATTTTTTRRAHGGRRSSAEISHAVMPPRRVPGQQPPVAALQMGCIGHVASPPLRSSRVIATRGRGAVGRGGSPLTHLHSVRHPPDTGPAHPGGSPTGSSLVVGLCDEPWAPARSRIPLREQEVARSGGVLVLVPSDGLGRHERVRDRATVAVQRPVASVGYRFAWESDHVAVAAVSALGVRPRPAVLGAVIGDERQAIALRAAGHCGPQRSPTRLPGWGWAGLRSTAR